MRRTHSLLIAALVAAMAFWSCRHNPDNAIGKDGMLKVDWEKIHEQERRDSLAELVCLQLYEEKIDLDSINHFLRQGANPNYVFSYEISRKKFAAMLPLVNLFVIDKYREIDVSTTPLNLALGRGDLQAAEAILKAGADVNGGQSGTDRPIDEAIAQSDLKMVKWLTSQGANVALGDLGYTSKVRFIDSLMAMGADGSTIDMDGFIQDGNYADIKRMMSYKKELKEVDCFRLVRFSGTKMIRFLLENGMDPNATCSNASGGTVLLESADAEEWESVKVLLNAGADPNVEDGFGHTPLYEVAESGDSSVASLLLAKGANVRPNPALGDDEGPIEVAVENDNLQMVAWLMRHDRKLSKAVVFELSKKYEAPRTRAWIKTVK